MKYMRNYYWRWNLMKNNMEKLHSLLGLAMRAGKLVSGEDGTMLDLKKNKLNLVIVATDASNNTKKLFKDKSSFRKVNYIELSTKDGLGMSIGKDSIDGLRLLGILTLPTARLALTHWCAACGGRLRSGSA